MTGRQHRWAVGALVAAASGLAGCGATTPAAPSAHAVAARPFRVVARRTARLTAGRLMQPAAFSALAVTADGWLAGVPGSSGTVLACSTDGGRTWTRRATLPGAVTALTFPTPAVGYALQTQPGTAPVDSALLRTVDGGRTWTPVYRAGLAAVDFLSPDQGYALALRGPLPTLLTTADGGRSWAAEAVFPQAKGALAARMAWSGSRIGWILLASEPGAGSQAKVLYTTVDGGRTWSLTAASAPMAGMFAARPPNAGILPTGGYVGSLVVFDALHARLALVRGGTWTTADGGRTWTPVWLQAFPPDVRDVVDLDMPTPTHGIALTGRGAVWVTTNGVTWRRRYPPGPRITAVAARPGALAILTAGGQLQTEEKGRWTVQGIGPATSLGITWAGSTLLVLRASGLVQPGHLGRIRSLPPGWRLVAAGFRSSRNGVAVVLPEAHRGQPMLALTVDGGRHWRLMPTPFRPARAALGPQRWWVVGGVARTRNVPPTPKLPELQWNLFLTANGGRSWKEIDTEQPSIDGLDVVSPQDAWFWTDTTLYRTSDGGRTWTAMTLPDVLVGGAFSFSSATLGWAVGPAGYPLYRTDDGGLSWQAATIPGLPAQGSKPKSPSKGNW